MLMHDGSYKNVIRIDFVKKGERKTWDQAFADVARLDRHLTPETF